MEPGRNLEWYVLSHERGTIQWFGRRVPAIRYPSGRVYRLGRDGKAWLVSDKRALKFRVDS